MISRLFKEAWAARPCIQGAVGILPTSFDSRAPPARSTLRAKSFAARVPIQNGYKSSPFFLSLDSYRLASCPDAARGADALKKDAEPRMNANILFPRQTEYFLREVLCALHASAFRFCPAISRTVSLGFHAKREWAWWLETTATVGELAETLAIQNLEQNVPRTDSDFKSQPR